MGSCVPVRQVLLPFHNHSYMRNEPNYGKFSCRSEWFYGDCEVKDEKIRKDLVYNWVRSAYMSGYELGGTLEELAHKTPQDPPDAL